MGADLRKKTMENLRAARGDAKCDLVFKNANILDVFSGTWIKGDLAVNNGQIVGVGEEYFGNEEVQCNGGSLVPGFIDSHVHIESTMMTPEEFARAVLPRGTTTAIWDPHEIANVWGQDGLDWAIRSAENSVMDLFVMLSSCVPSSQFENSGARLEANDLVRWKNSKKVLGLAEVMDFPSVIAGEEKVLDKLEAFSDRPKDGHAPMVRGKPLNAYLTAGIRTCHESCSLEEAREKLSKGMRVMVREGSVAKNAAEMSAILTEYSGVHCFLCTDDRNPLDIQEEGHIDYLLRVAMEKGKSPEIVYRSASLAPALFYGLYDRGALAPGYTADVVLLADLKTAKVANVWKAGKKIQDAKWPASVSLPKRNSFSVSDLREQKFSIRARKDKTVEKVNVMEVVPKQIFTKRTTAELNVFDGEVSGTEHIQKIAVVERHKGTGRVGVAFVKGFHLARGVIASSVAHDAHNIVVVGNKNELMARAATRLTEMGGGLLALDDGGEILAELALPIGGLMSNLPYQEMIPLVHKIRTAVRQLGCSLEEPFLQMSFLALPVIPSLKITDLGLIDVEAQAVIDVFA